jgi:hypothetical protein
MKDMTARPLPDRLRHLKREAKELAGQSARLADGDTPQGTEVPVEARRRTLALEFRWVRSLQRAKALKDRRLARKRGLPSREAKTRTARRLPPDGRSPACGRTPAELRALGHSGIRGLRVVRPAVPNGPGQNL